MKQMTFSHAKEMMRNIADNIIEAKPLLTEVDSAIGDGDHGIGMELGMKKAKEKLDKMADTGNVFDTFILAGKTMIMSMGGASGVIFGSMFQAGGKAMPAKAEMKPEDMAEMMAKSLAAIQERGKAQVGDKTMVDALSPAVDAMRKHAKEGFVKMLEEAAKAALAGVEHTKNVEAKFGRAKTQGSTIGCADAGAVSVSIIFKSMYEFAGSNMSAE